MQKLSFYENFAKYLQICSKQNISKNCMLYLRMPCYSDIIEKKNPNLIEKNNNNNK